LSIDYRRIYRDHARDYESLVAAEDREGNILDALQSIGQFRGAQVLEVGVGTGRITRLLAPHVARIHGCDNARGMLSVARAQLPPRDIGRVTLSLADARALPLSNGWADVGVAGWVFGHFTEWSEATWRAEIGRAIGEMERTVRPEGTIIILETLGTGTTDPGPPTPVLAAYYRWLEQERGFSWLNIRTDYEFPSISQAIARIRFFFGDELAARVKHRRVPEWTGVWSKRGTLTGTSRVKHPTRV